MPLGDLSRTVPLKGQRYYLDTSALAVLAAVESKNRGVAIPPAYGGRGIQIHSEWLKDPAAFIAYIGRRPNSDYSLERIDTNGHYEPGNVKWATKAEQSRNRRFSSRSGRLTPIDVQFIKHWIRRGHVHAQIAKSFGISHGMIYRISRGLAWSDIT